MNDLDSIFDDDWPEDHRSGVVVVVGRPNVGKSTLINRILGQKIAIVTPKPQTTRKRQLGIYTEEHGQILFVDTPGLHKPHHKLGEYMVKVATNALRDADLILWILDVSRPPTGEDKHIAETIKRRRGDEGAPVILALNKVDLLKADAATEVGNEHRKLVPYDSYKLVSALEGAGVEDLVKHLLAKLPLGPRYYPADQLSETNMRFIAAEVVREKVILNTEQEIPHASAVEIDSYQEGEERTTISGIIYVERETQKRIVVGKGGRLIKKIGSEARQELMDMLDRPVHLDLRVKVLKDWRRNDSFMRRLGYRGPKKGKR